MISFVLVLSVITIISNIIWLSQLIQEYNNTTYSSVVTGEIISNSSYTPITMPYDEFDEYITFSHISNNSIPIYSSNSTTLNIVTFYTTNRNSSI